MRADEYHHYQMIKKYTRSKYTPTSVHTTLLIRTDLLKQIKYMSYATQSMRVQKINQMRTILNNKSVT